MFQIRTVHETENQHPHSNEGGEQLVRTSHELITEHVAERQVLAAEQTAYADTAEQRAY